MSPAGAVIMSIFAAVWWVAGVRVSHHESLLMYALPLLVSLGIAVAAMCTHAKPETPEEGARAGRLFGIASAVEGVLIFVALNVLLNLRRPDLIAPVMALIVGGHFLPLARWLPVSSYYVTGALMIAAGVMGFAIPDLQWRFLIVGIAAACVLWATSAMLLLSLRRSRS